MSQQQIDFLQGVVQELELLERLRRKIDSYRKISESTTQTLERILELASLVLCKECRGYGHNLLGSTCRVCKGSGHLEVPG